jgi:heme oxygenase
MAVGVNPVDGLTADNNPRKLGLALMLDDGTRKLHSMAESTLFVAGFFKGLATRESFGSLMTSLYFVYNSMEVAMSRTTETCVQKMDYKSLRRLESLKKDMDFFHGSNVSIVYCN